MTWRVIQCSFIYNIFPKLMCKNNRGSNRDFRKFSSRRQFRFFLYCPIQWWPSCAIWTAKTCTFHCLHPIITRSRYLPVFSGHLAPLVLSISSPLISKSSSASVNHILGTDPETWLFFSLGSSSPGGSRDQTVNYTLNWLCTISENDKGTKRTIRNNKEIASESECRGCIP